MRKAAVVASVLAGMGACLDGTGLRVPENAIGVIVSGLVRAPLQTGSAPGPAAAPGSSAGVVYVSLPPGSVPTGVQATITNQATRLSVPAVVIAGGFDPVPILASAGDAIAVEVTGSGAPVGVLLAVSSVRPLKVVRTSPASGGRDVPLNATIVIVFSEPINPTALTTGAVQLWHDTTSVAGTTQFADSAHLHVVFQPTVLLGPQTEYRVVLTKAIQDVSGVTLDSPLDVSFTTGTATSAPTATSLAVEGFPTSVPTGISAFDVYALDASGHRAAGYGGRVHFTSTDSLAVLPLDYTFVGPDAGVHPFTVTFNTLGTQTVTATDMATSSITGSARVAVTPGALAPLTVSPTPVVFGNQTIGTTSTPRTVTLTNTGSATEPVTIVMNGFSWSDFAETSDCPSTLAVGASCTISITVTPGASGSRPGVLVIDRDLPQEVYVSEWATGTAGLSVAVVPDPSGKFGKFVYVTNSGADNVSMYGINPATGTLMPLLQPRIAAGTHPVSVAVDPSGRFAYVANLGSNDVSMFTIDPNTGALTSIGSPVRAGSGPVSVAVAPDPSGTFGKFAYVANVGSNDVSMYTIDAATGALTPTGLPITAQYSPISVAVHTTGKFAYVATDGCVELDTHYLNTCVLMYSINATTGALTLEGMTHPGYQSPSSIAIDPSGRFAYLTDGGTNDVLTFRINATTGALTLTTGYESVNRSPTAVAVDPSGQFAYVLNAGPTSPPCSYLGCSGVSMFGIDANGVLTSKGMIAAGSYPTSIAIDPSGKFVYVANVGSQDISMFRIGTDGTLTLTGTIGT